MSTMLATMANALIEFILSLLRDPELAAEFEEAPEATLASRGLEGMSHNDLCTVLPIVYDHPQVVQKAAAVTHDPGGSTDVIRELRNVVHSNSYVTNNSTLVDQSVNQNIWSEGDVMQLFDNEAVLATGQDSTAAGDDVVHDSSQDSSTTVVAGDDAVVDNDVDVSTVEDSYNTDDSTTDASITATVTYAESDAEPEPAPEPALAATPADDEAAMAVDDGLGALSEPEPLADATADDEF